jgi:nucleoside 2-deoxyribosyltransferase
MKLAYVAGPYRAARERQVVENIRKAEEVALALWKLGFAVICPHKNTALFGGAHGLADDVWLQGDLVMLERCDLIVMTPRWADSSGAIAELQHARAKGIPVFMWLTDLGLLKALVAQ